MSICGHSPAGVNATWRAALVARDIGATLHILHPAAEPPVLGRAQTSPRELADDITQRTRVDVVVEAVGGNVLRRAIEMSQHAAMVVLPSSRRNPLREWIMGSPAERLIRLCRSPVLVVKRPALVSYRRVLVPVDLDGQAVPLIDLALSLSRGSRMEVLHVINATDEKAVCAVGDSVDALQGLRQHRAQGAYLAIHQLIDASRPDGTGAEALIGFGHAPAVVLERAAQCGAELMVLGKSQRGLFADYFLGGTTQRILARAPADVLVYTLPRREREVPLARKQAAAKASGLRPVRPGGSSAQHLA